MMLCQKKAHPQVELETLIIWREILESEERTNHCIIM